MRSSTILYLAAGLALSACSVNPQQPPGNSAAPGEQATITAAQHVASIDERAPAPPQATQPEKISTVWQTLRDGFALPQPERASIEREAAGYTADPDYLARVGTRARPYLSYIVRQLQERDLPMELALVPVIESAYRPNAYSYGHAAGLWQFVAATGRHYGLRQDWWYDGRRDFTAATDAALDYLTYLHEFFEGDWLLAIAAYNAGEGTVQRAMRRNRRRGEPTDFWHLDLPAETEAYVPRLLAVRDIIAEPAAYGVDLPAIENKRRVRVVELDSQIDLTLAADLAGITTERLYRLNPGYNRWATPPEGPHRIVLPASQAEQFRAGLAATPPAERMRWRRHQVARGDSLGEIADRYHTSVAVLRDVNDLGDSNIIRVGAELIVPLGGRPDDDAAVAANDSAERRQTMAYTVRRGDSLYRIAQRFNVGVPELRRWNELPRGDLLRPGQRLQVQVDSTRHSY